MADLPPLNSLRTFLFAAETQSFKLAAKRLFVTQAAVSHQIRLLEDILGTQLFVRLNREVKLTDEGEKLLPYVRSAFTALKTGVEKLKSDSSPNHLTISVLPSLASSWLVPRLKDFQEHNPDMHVTLKPSLKLVNFEDSEIDLAIRFSATKPEDLHSEFLSRDAMMVVATPEFLKDKTVTMENLMDFPLIEDLGPGGSGWVQWLTEQQKDAREYRITLTIEDASMLLDAALSGQGIALARKTMAHDLVEQGKLVRLFDFELPSPYSYFLVGPENNFRKEKVRVFRDWLKLEIEHSFQPDLFAYYGS